MCNLMEINIICGTFGNLTVCICCLCTYRKDDDPEPTPETRDSRTVFVMQLSQRVRAKDLEDFFSSVGKVSI